MTTHFLSVISEHLDILLRPIPCVDASADGCLEPVHHAKEGILCLLRSDAMRFHTYRINYMTWTILTGASFLAFVNELSNILTYGNVKLVILQEFWNWSIVQWHCYMFGHWWQYSAVWSLVNWSLILICDANLFSCTRIWTDDNICFTCRIDSSGHNESPH